MRIEHSVWKCICDKCGHNWVSKDSNIPLRCTRCQSKDWGSELGESGKYPKGIKEFVGGNSKVIYNAVRVESSDEQVIVDVEGA